MAETATCAIIGGGPAGMFLGLLLARAGVQVTLLEKHGDFLRDFRGDTVHPTTLRLLDELGLWERFAALPHSEVQRARLDVDGRSVTYVDFGRLGRLGQPQRPASGGGRIGGGAEVHGRRQAPRRSG